MACCVDINVSQGNVATYARCGGIFNIHSTANLLRNFTEKKFINRLRFDRNMVISLWRRFFGPHCIDKSFMQEVPGAESAMHYCLVAVVFNRINGILTLKCLA